MLSTRGVSAAPSLSPLNLDREVLQAAHAFASLPDEVSSHLMGSLLGPTLAIQRMRKSAAITRRRKG